MNQLIRLAKRRPEVAVGVAAFVGLALGAGWFPLPSLAGLRPSSSAPKPTATPPPPPDPLSF